MKEGKQMQERDEMAVMRSKNYEEGPGGATIGWSVEVETGIADFAVFELHAPADGGLGIAHVQSLRNDG